MLFQGTALAVLQPPFARQGKHVSTWFQQHSLAAFSEGQRALSCIALHRGSCPWTFHLHVHAFVEQKSTQHCCRLYHQQLKH
jgi:hypothetical protein